jgi:hypothetical protein
MGNLSHNVVDQAMHPLDLVEEMIAMRDWVQERTRRDELLAEIDGRWCDYHGVFNWIDEIGALQLTFAFDMRTPPERRESVHELLAVLNERLGIGHFDVGSQDGLPAYRHALLLDRFYPAFQYVVWGNQSAHAAVSSIMFDTVGEA